MNGSAPLSGSQGSVLDPIVAIRYRVTLDPEESATINMVSGIGETRDACLGLVEKYQDRRLADASSIWRGPTARCSCGRSMPPRPTRSSTDAGRLGHLRQFLAARRPERPHQEPPRAIRPVGLRHFRRFADRAAADRRPANIELVRQLVQAHAYWRLKGLAVDLVIWNEDHAGYRQLLHEQIMGLIAAGHRSQRDGSAGRHLRKTCDQISKRGPHPVPNGRPRHHHRQPGERWRTRSTAAARVQKCRPALTPTRAPPDEPPEPHCLAAI
jgi:cyclic beta-1,2-glucan synthetase